MPAERYSLQDLIRSRQQSGFFGRQSQVIQFHENLMLPVTSLHRRFIFNIHGNAGVGKTYLTKQLCQDARESGALTAYTDEIAGEPFLAMSAIAAEFARSDVRLSEFEKRATEYRQRRQELESDPQAPEGIASFLTKTAVVVALAAARDVPIAGSLFAPLDAATVAEQANRARTYLARKFSDHADVRLLMSPAEELSPVFVAGLNRVGANRQVAIFLDTYERTSSLLGHWLRDLYVGKYGNLPATLVCTISGQYPLNLNLWGDYLSVIADVPLEPFTGAEARQYLASKGVTDESIIDIILKLSGGLPMWLVTLADSRPDNTTDIGDPAGDAVDRFLKWESDPTRRAIAVKAALPRTFNQDVLEVLRPPDSSNTLFTWLSGLPFVSQQMGSWRYHDVVRSAMLRLARAQSPNEWRANQLALAKAYEIWAAEVTGRTGELWKNPDWVNYFREKIYHLLCADPVKNLPEALISAVNAASAGITAAREWATLFDDAARDADNAILQRWAQHLKNSIDEDDVAKYLSFLINEGCLDEKVRLSALRTRSRIHMTMRQYNEALGDLSHALELDPDNVTTLARRGDIYYRLERYAEALADLDRALEINPDNVTALTWRGQTYNRLERYDDAFADLSRAVELKPANILSWIVRSNTYRIMRRFEEAAADIDHILELDSTISMNWVLRGISYQQMGRENDALSDFNRAIELDPENALAWLFRGMSYQQMDRYDEALANLDRALEISPDNATALSYRGRTYQQMKRYDEALVDLNRAIELDPNDATALSRRGQIYQRLARYDDALADLGHAIELDARYTSSLISRGRTYQLMGRYEEALVDLDRALEFDPTNASAFSLRGWVNMLTKRYDEAITDFNKAIELDPNDDGILLGRGWTYQLMERYDEALVDLNRALELDPDDVVVLERRGETYLMTGSYDKAKADFERVTAIDPDAAPSMADGLVPRAVSHLKKGEPEKAADIFKAVIGISPNEARAHNNYAFCLLPIDPRRALEEFTVAHEIRPDRLMTLVNMVLAYHLLGRDDEAISLGESDGVESLSDELGLMWDIDDSHTLHLVEHSDVRKSLKALLSHIKKESSST